MDALGSNIRVDTKGQKLCALCRVITMELTKNGFQTKLDLFGMELRRQRLDTPYVRENGKLRVATWSEALEKAKLEITVRKYLVLLVI